IHIYIILSSPYFPNVRARRSSYSRSRSPRRRHDGRRPPHPPNPDPSNVLGVFGLSCHTTEEDLDRLFGAHGALERVSIVYDRSPDHTGRIAQKSRGFAFITFESIAGASAARDALDGTELHARRMRVDYSLTRKPHDPTPGVYKGDPRDSYRSGHSSRRHDPRDSYHDDYRRRRSPSHSPRRRSSRRSPSPRGRSSVSHDYR
ncbi:splicing factor, arginine/serine-rich 10, partial [Geranomyces variabilis]